jgi:hypothetical protein
MRLASDRWAILQAMPAETGQPSVVHAFFVNQSTYETFGYHPIHLLDQTLLALERQTCCDRAPQPVDIQTSPLLPIERNLQRAIERWTIHRIAVFLDCLLVGPQAAALINDRPRCAVSALYSLLPPACRAELTCSGLTADNSAFPFRVLFLTEDATSWTPLLEAGRVTIFDWSCDLPISADLHHPWSQLALRDLHGGCVRRWLDYVQELPAEVTFEDLKRIAQTELNKYRESRSLEFEIDAIAMNTANDFELCFQEDVRSDYPPRRKGALDLSREEVLEQLDRLDDAAWDAIAGSDIGLSRLEELWPQIKSQLAANLVEESREQYVRLIVDQCQQSSDTETVASPAVIDVLKLLFCQ